METLLIPATETSPRVYFNPETPVNNKYLFEIAGESRPEDVKKFFNPIYAWIEEFKLDSQYWGILGRKIRLKFKLDYINSSSAKCFLEIIERIDQLQKAYPKTDFKIIWTYDEFDEDMKDAGEEFAKMTSVPFHIVLNYLYIEPTKNTPKILVNTEKKLFEITGKSFGEKLEEHYEPLFEWIDKYGSHYFNEGFTFNFKLQYFNSPSLLIIRDILKKLNKLFLSGHDISINYHYDIDEDIEDIKMLFVGIEMPYKLLNLEV